MPERPVYLLDDGNDLRFRPHRPELGDVDACPWALALHGLDKEPFPTSA
ncbi:hypothetical protein [Streptomyces sp. NPDC093598]